MATTFSPHLKNYWTWQATHCALLDWITSNNRKLPIVGAFSRGHPLKTIVTIVITIANHCYHCHHPSLVWLSSPLPLVWLSSPLFPLQIIVIVVITHLWYDYHLHCHWYDYHHHCSHHRYQYHHNVYTIIGIIVIPVTNPVLTVITDITTNVDQLTGDHHCGHQCDHCYHHCYHHWYHCYHCYHPVLIVITMYIISVTFWPLSPLHLTLKDHHDDISYDRVIGSKSSIIARLHLLYHRSIIVKSCFLILSALDVVRP